MPPGHCPRAKLTQRGVRAPGRADPGLPSAQLHAKPFEAFSHQLRGPHKRPLFTASAKLTLKLTSLFSATGQSYCTFCPLRGSGGSWMHYDV